MDAMALSGGLTEGQLNRVARVAVGCLVALVSVVMPAEGAAAAPPNDNFADAIELSGLPAEATGSNVGATREPGEPNHQSQNGERSIWFKWTAPTDAGVTLSSSGCAPPFQDSFPGAVVTAVYSRTDVFGLVQVAAGSQPFRAQAGQTYWIAADSPPNALPDPDICVRVLRGPPNDDFARATPLTGFPVSVTQGTPGLQTELGNEGGATREIGEPYHGGESGGPSVWYSWRAPFAGPVLLRTCGTVAMTAVYTGDRIDALTHVATRRTRDGACGDRLGARVMFSAIAGRVYRIAVVSPGSATSPSFDLMVGNQVAVVTGAGKSFVSYSAFPGQNDRVKLRLAGTGRQRALLLEAHGVTTAVGCQAGTRPAVLRCAVPGSAALVLDIDLGDGSDTADVRL
jgi:hypothetical protein